MASSYRSRSSSLTRYLLVALMTVAFSPTYADVHDHYAGTYSPIATIYLDAHALADDGLIAAVESNVDALAIQSTGGAVIAMRNTRTAKHDTRSHALRHVAMLRHVQAPC